MAQNRYYSSTAQPTTLSASVTNIATTISVAAITGFPTSFPYMICVDVGQSAEELMLVTASSGTGPYTLTVTRGVDGTTAAAHNSGAVVRHSYAALDFTEAGQHIGATSGVHGVSGSVVGTSDTQSLSNKTFTAGTASTIAAIIQGASGQSADLSQWQDSTGAELAKIDHTGQISSKVGIVMDDGFPTGLRAADATYPELFVQLGLNSPTNQRTMIVRATKNQTSALLELQDVNGNTLMYFDNNGYPWFTQTNAGLEIGSQAAANTPYVDFHSSGGTVDYDVRLLASGGSTTSGGQGNLGFYAGNVIFNGPVQFNDNIQDANGRRLPRGRVGTTKVTSNSAAITTTGQGVQVASCSFTAQAGHRYVIRACGLVQCATAANSFNTRIIDPTGTTIAQFQDTCNAANFGYGFNLEGDYVAGSNGSVSAALYLAAINSAAAVTALGNASFPLTLVVEDLGS